MGKGVFCTVNVPALVAKPHGVLTATVPVAAPGITIPTNVSPVLDTQRMSAFTITNRLNNPTSGTTPDYVAETVNTGGSAAAKYMTRPVQLSNPSTALDIRLSAYVPSTSTIEIIVTVVGITKMDIRGERRDRSSDHLDATWGNHLGRAGWISISVPNSPTDLLL